MSLKKNLVSKKAQSVVEYVTLLLVVVTGIIAVFVSFNPEAINVKTTFDSTVDRAISNINNGW
ncbi:MAG: hypothetical protein WC658_03300 [Candidatus Omnitrophota bacterium]